MLSLAYLLFSLSLVGVHALPQPQGAPTNPGFPGEPGGGATATKTVTVTATPASPVSSYLPLPTQDGYLAHTCDLMKSDPGAITGAANLGPLGTYYPPRFPPPKISPTHTNFSQGVPSTQALEPKAGTAMPRDQRVHSRVSLEERSAQTAIMGVREERSKGLGIRLVCRVERRCR